MTIHAGSLLFADSNVLIEGLFIPASHASIVVKIVATGAFKLATCKPAILDVENTILKKLNTSPEHLDIVLELWHSIQKRTMLTVFPAAPHEIVKQTYDDFIALMRHEADITILAAALAAKPAVILSNNREHFNNAVAKKSGIQIFSCAEFIELLTPT